MFSVFYLTMLLCRCTIKTVHTESCTRRETAKCWGLSMSLTKLPSILSFYTVHSMLIDVFEHDPLRQRSGMCQCWPGISERQERSECRTKRNMASEVPEEGNGLTNVWHPKHRYKTLFEAHFKALWLIENDRLKSIIWFCMMKWCFQHWFFQRPSQTPATELQPHLWSESESSEGQRGHT